MQSLADLNRDFVKSIEIWRLNAVSGLRQLTFIVFNSPLYRGGLKSENPHDSLLCNCAPFNYMSIAVQRDALNAIGSFFICELFIDFHAAPHIVQHIHIYIEPVSRAGSLAGNTFKCMQNIRAECDKATI